MPAERTIGIMTVLNLEWEAALLAFGLKPDDCQNQEPYASTVIRASNGDPTRVYIGKALRSGTTEHVLPTYQMIQELDPECMILCGIACGLRETPLCSVVAAGSVYAYEYTKTTPDMPIDDSRFSTVPRALRDCMETFSPALQREWRDTLGSSLKASGYDLAVTNLQFKKNRIIASGNKVIKDGMLEELHRTHPRIWAGEMEAHGFAEACNYDSDAGLRWTVIRGISDHGGLDKSDPDLKNKHHFPAALSAATMCRVFLEKAYSPSKRHALTTPLRRYMIGKIRSRALDGVDEFRRRDVDPEMTPKGYSDEVKRRLDHSGVRRAVALCGGKGWGYTPVRSYYDLCLGWAKSKCKHDVADRSHEVQRMTRLFYEPEDGFSDWDRCVMVQHHQTPGAIALTFKRGCLGGAFEDVADDILQERLGFVAFDDGPGLLLGSEWSVILHAGGLKDFRVGECRREYAVREMISLLRHLIDRADVFMPTDEDLSQYSDWKNAEDAYYARFPECRRIPEITTGPGATNYGAPAGEQESRELG